jgi:tripartite-type tricarboxylate transporter receptor subunit TctC
MHALARLVLTCALTVVAHSATAQPYPSKPIRLIVGFSAGGGTDIMARLIGQKLTEWWGQQVIVENRVGATGTIAADFVAKSPPDGYTLMLGSINQNAIAPALYSKITYNPVKDFAPIVYVGYTPLLLLTHPSLPVKSVSELVALAKSRPGQLTAASPGNGTAHHLSLELFMATTGTRIIHVPYKGSSQAIIDLVAGQVQISFDVPPVALEQIKRGRLNALAITTRQRSPKLPDVPTLDESGLKGFEIINWYGFFAPAATPKEVVAKLNADMNKALQDPTVNRRLDEIGMEIGGGTSESFDAYARAEVVKFEKLVKASGVKLE